MNNKHYFLIKNSYNEYESGYTCICESFEEAKKEIANYADWYCEKGSGTIVEVDSHMNRIRKWEFRNNEIKNSSSGGLRLWL